MAERSLDYNSPMTEQAPPKPPPQSLQLLHELVNELLRSLREGEGDADKRRQVEEWLRLVSDKYPDFKIESGLRDYYLAEAGRYRAEFDKADDLTQKLALGRAVESYLDKAVDYAARASR